MKILGILAVLFLLTLAGGFGFFAFMDVPVTPKEVTKEIPNDRTSAN
jgi:hypothetical protein